MRIKILLAGLCLPLAAHAQTGSAPTGTSKPQPVAITDPIPPARDVPYPGTIRIAVDATDVAHGIYRVAETIPVAAGHLVLLYPAWLPGGHAPEGEIDKLAGLTISGGGKPIAWKRDTVDVHAFHLDVPAGVSSIDVAFQFLSATNESQGAIVMTPNILALEWIATTLYPAGYYARQITVDASATYPAGWTSATALRPSGPATAAGGTIHYAPVALDTLIDSPVFAGRYARTEALSPDVTLNLFAEAPGQLAATPAQIAPHKALVEQATRLYGAQHYSHYDFLFALSDRIQGFGLEHHRSSENQGNPGYFTDWDANVADRDLLPHEFTHSWNGKFRRPADLWTPDYRTPMQNSLLWVYEGQTQFWGNVLAARSGLVPKQDALDALAMVAASYHTLPGRAWRPLVDTTNEEIISERRPVPFRDWLRGEDYYQEGQLIWLEADSLIRERSGGRRSLDDFARAFFGVRDRDWGELTYTFDDVVATLNRIQPYDWATFLHERVDAVAPHAPLAGITRGGYRLVYDDKATPFWKAREADRKITDLTYSLGMVIGEGGAVSSVRWDGPAFRAGISPGTTIVAVGGEGYAASGLKDAVTAAKGGGKPIPLLIKQRGAFRTVDVMWDGGLRYPHLERTGKGPSSLDALYAPRK